MADLGNHLRPNTFQTPNLLVDHLMPLLENGELRVVIFAARHIYGWPETNAAGRERLSITAFERGHRGSKGCGLGRPAIVAALGSLSSFGVMKKDGKPTRKGQLWGLADHQDEIDWEGLEQRARVQKDKARRQTARATQASKKTSAVRSTNQSGGTSNEPETGTFNEPPGGTFNEPETGTSNVLIETHSLKPILETHESAAAGSIDSASADPNQKAAAVDAPSSEKTALEEKADLLTTATQIATDQRATSAAPSPDLARVVKHFENNIQPITSVTAEKIKEAVALYPADWIVEAIDQAVLNNARRWVYIQAILERRQTGGTDERTRSPRPGSPTQDPGRTNGGNADAGSGTAGSQAGIPYRKGDIQYDPELQEKRRQYWRDHGYDDKGRKVRSVQ